MTELRFYSINVIKQPLKTPKMKKNMQFITGSKRRNEENMFKNMQIQKKKKTRKNKAQV